MDDYNQSAIYGEESQGGIENVGSYQSEIHDLEKEILEETE